MLIYRCAQIKPVTHHLFRATHKSVWRTAWHDFRRAAPVHLLATRTSRARQEPSSLRPQEIVEMATVTAHRRGVTGQFPSRPFPGDLREVGHQGCRERTLPTRASVSAPGLRQTANSSILRSVVLKPLASCQLPSDPGRVPVEFFTFHVSGCQFYRRTTRPNSRTGGNGWPDGSRPTPAVWQSIQVWLGG